MELDQDKKHRWANRIWIAGMVFTGLLLFSIGWVAYYGNFNVRKTPQMLTYRFKPDKDDASLKIEHQWVPLDSMSRNIIIAVLAAEDPNLYIHGGFAPINEDDSIVSIIPKHHETITQKTAHTVFLTRGDSWIKDILEPYFSVLQEYLWGKDRILEIYLNTVLTGNGIFGVEAASRIYFSKPSGELTRQEAAFIAALLENPESINIENPGKEVLKRKNEILLNMDLMMHIKLGKEPVDEKEFLPAKPIYRRNWRGKSHRLFLIKTAEST